MRKRILPQAVLFTLGGAMLTACGGGGGDSDNASNDGGATAAPATTLVITGDNAQQTAQAAYDTGLILGNTGLAIASAGNGNANTHSITLTTIIEDAIDRTRKHGIAGAGDRITAQATETHAEDCPYGGSIQYQEVGLDDDPSTLQAGDSLTMTFNACMPDDSTEFNGQLSVAFTSISENTDTRFKATASFTSNNFSIKSGSESASMNGTIMLSMDATDSDTAEELLLGLQSDKFEITYNTNKAVFYALDYKTYEYYPYATGDWHWWFEQDNSLDINGEVIRVDTTARFDANGCNYPYQGSGMIYGKNSSVKVTARSGNVTDLEIDTDGNGTIDVTEQVGSGEVFSLSCGY